MLRCYLSEEAAHNLCTRPNRVFFCRRLHAVNPNGSCSTSKHPDDRLWSLVWLSPHLAAVSRFAYCKRSEGPRIPCSITDMNSDLSFLRKLSRRKVFFRLLYLILPTPLRQVRGGWSNYSRFSIWLAGSVRACKKNPLVIRQHMQCVNGSSVRPFGDEACWQGDFLPGRPD